MEKGGDVTVLCALILQLAGHMARGNLGSDPEMSIYSVRRHDDANFGRQDESETERRGLAMTTVMKKAAYLPR